MHSPIPGFVRSLNALSAILDKAEAFAEAKKIKPEVIPGLRLIADMLPFWRQVTLATDHAKGAAARLAGVEIPSFPDEEETLADLKARIAKTVAFLESLPADAFEGAEARTVTLRLGGQDHDMPAPVYLSSFAIPNLYFHLATAYDILRANGLDIGKADFIGR